MNRNEDIKQEMSEIHNRLLLERRARITVLILLLSALIFSIIYGTLENPFQYTLSKIGNRFAPEYRVLFIIWSITTSAAIQISILALFKLENYYNKRSYRAVISAVIFLVITAILPALDETPISYRLHTYTGVLFAFFITIGFLPFMQHVVKENEPLKRVIYIWLAIIWIGSSSCMFIFGNTGIFEMFFFITFIIFLMYITLTLFERQIIKRSVTLLNGYEDVERGIGEIFFPEFLKHKAIKRKISIRTYLKEDSEELVKE